MTLSLPKKKTVRSQVIKKGLMQFCCKTSILQSKTLPGPHQIKCNLKPAAIHPSQLPLTTLPSRTANLQDTSQNFHFGLSRFPSAIGRRQLATQRFHLPAKGCMKLPHPIDIQRMRVPNIKCKIMEVYGYGSLTVLGRT